MLKNTLEPGAHTYLQVHGELGDVAGERQLFLMLLVHAALPPIPVRAGAVAIHAYQPPAEGAKTLRATPLKT